MGIFDFFKPKDKSRRLLLDLIAHNAEIIERDEGKSRSEAEYLAICRIIDDLRRRPNGREGYLKVMDILKNEHQRHLNEVVTYFAWATGQFDFKPEFDALMRARHSKKWSMRERQLKAVTVNEIGGRSPSMRRRW